MHMSAGKRRAASSTHLYPAAWLFMYLTIELMHCFSLSFASVDPNSPVDRKCADVKTACF